MAALLTGFFLVGAVAAIVAFPLFRPPSTSHASGPGGNETLQREKSVALLAIKEAQFDHAMGKLADADYALLRREYEERAVRAIRGLETERPTAAEAGPSTAAALANFCQRCGRRFSDGDRFCASCGLERAALSAQGAT